MRFTSLKSIACAAALSLVAACGSDSKTTIIDAAAANGNFTTLLTAVEAAGLTETLEGDGPFTVFAPTDAAFAALPAALDLTADINLLTQILQYHVVSGEVPASAVVGLSEAMPLAGGPIDIQVVDGTVVLDGRIQVTTTDLETDNGIIHVIDAVMFPGDFPGNIVDALAASPRFSELVGAVTTASTGATNVAGVLTDAQGTLTVFAPTNDGFARLPAGLNLDADTLAAVLTHHVLGAEVRAADAIALAGMADPTTPTLNATAGLKVSVDTGSVFLNERSQVTYTNIETSNGVIHVIDSVLVPGVYPGTIVDALSAYPRFDSLVGAVVSADLANTVATTADITVFAPTNTAFGAVDTSGLSMMELADVLQYHVLGLRAPAATVVGLSTATALQGDDITITINNGVFLNTSTEVIFTDFEASNGIIHILDGVLLPPA